MVSIQGSLFPDAFEVQDAAFAALEAFDVPEAVARVRQARARDPGLVGLDRLEQGLVWLSELVGGEPPSAEVLARVFLALPRACERGGLSPSAAGFLDQTLARHALRRDRDRADVFLDRERRVHLGALHLICGHVAAARALLNETVAAGTRERADLWAYLGDAHRLDERGDDANACYVRALVLSAPDVDLFRSREPRLVEIHAQLAAAYPPDEARERLLVQAWIEGVLAIHPENEWLERRRLDTWAADTPAPAAPARERLRAFARLLYLDQTRRAVDLDLRERMMSLDRALFLQYMAACRARERSATPRFSW
jgi:hypothetical protein